MDKFRVVTALYNLGRGRLEGQFKRPFETYQEWFKELLKTDLPLTIYCEPELMEYIWEYRSFIDYSMTTVIPLHKEEFLNPTLLILIENLRTDHYWINGASWLAGSPQAALKWYNPLVMSKLQMLSNEANLSEYVVWLDAGVSATTDMTLFKNFEQRIIPYLNKILFLYFPYRDKEIHGFPTRVMDLYAGEKVERVVRATMFGGNRNYINAILSEYYDHLYRSLEDGFMGTEENIFTLVSYTKPEWCNLYALKPGVVRISDFLSTI